MSYRNPRLHRRLSLSLRLGATNPLCATPLLTGSFPYHPRRIDARWVTPSPSAARRCCRLSAAQSERRVHSVDERLPRDFDLSTAFCTRYPYLSLFLFTYLHLSPLFLFLRLVDREAPAAATGEGVRSNRATVHINGSLAVIPSCFRLLRPI